MKKYRYIVTELLLSLAAIALVPLAASADDGSRLWLTQEVADIPTGNVRVEGFKASSPTINIAMRELTAWKGHTVIIRKTSEKNVKRDGFVIRRESGGVCISSPSETGALYGVYHLLRLQQTGSGINGEIRENPQYEFRILNHWDNLDGTVERGYAGKSIFWEGSNPKKSIINNRLLRQYARANASVGINGTVLNNVNAQAEILNDDYIERLKSAADIFRPYGIRIYITANYASPLKIGGLKVNDPFDKNVIKWWRDKVKEIYRSVPDFGGFLIKANSEGQPGPNDYGRTHADGANMLADALKPYGGIVMWRAFVYSPNDNDRAKQAYTEFVPLDGKFRDNVIIQIKNGPIDFQPREPYSPLFGAMKKTKTMVEFQITQEYLGHANHLCYLAPMWEEFFASVDPSTLTAACGVANIGLDKNWCGHDFAQANWYAFGRQSWNPHLTSSKIADEWLRQTFTCDESFVEPVKKMMLESREAVVNYMMPLGLHHIFAENHHYGPGPWTWRPNLRPDWTATYYHQADQNGIGFDRTLTGSNAVSQYPADLCKQYGDAFDCPDEYLLWFHHLPWSFRMKSGRTLWDELCRHYQTGLEQAREFQRTWDSVKQYVDDERYLRVQNKLKIQTLDAQWWKDACLLYFQSINHLAIPIDIERPVHNLNDMKSYNIPLGIYGNAPYGFSK